jgi:histone deacetylase 1/2
MHTHAHARARTHTHTRMHAPRLFSSRTAHTHTHTHARTQAFFFSDKVFCLSFHHKKPGFFPGTGDATRIGAGPGRGKNMNVPLGEFTSDATFTRVFESVAGHVFECFQPDVIVLECGADGLAADRLGCWNLTTKSYLHVCSLIRSWDRPVLVLGGGGYNIANVSRCWTAVTAALAGVVLPDQIPDHDFFHLYGPSFSLQVDELMSEDTNSAESIAETLKSVRSALDLHPCDDRTG